VNVILRPTSFPFWNGVVAQMCLSKPTVPQERVRRIVDREVVGDTVERERAQCDAVRVAAGDAAEVGAALDVVVEVVEAERDVREVAAAVRHAHGLDDPAVRHDLDLHAVRIRQRVEVDGPFARRAERRLRDRRRGTLRGRRESGGEANRACQKNHDSGDESPAE
jgi:hypothetical protein